MKKGLLGSTALIGATALIAGAASAAEAPTYKVSGYMNFLAYMVSQDQTVSGVLTPRQDDATMFLGVNEAEFHFNANGATDNGLTYGLTMQMNANNEEASDEVYANIGGSWGKIEFGNNDGAEDSMAVGAESIMGATGGFDGEYTRVEFTDAANRAGGPSIAGDTGDSTKITYYSPDMSGLKAGLSYTPNVDAEGRTGGAETGQVNSIGLGGQYAGEVAGMKLKLGAVYVMDSNQTGVTTDENGSFSVGGIVGFQQFQVAASYGDSGTSGELSTGPETSYWNVGASFENGPMYLSAGYHVGTSDGGVGNEDEVSVMSLTADYSLAPGLALLAEANLSSSSKTATPGTDNDATTIIVGAKVSF